MDIRNKVNDRFKGKKVFKLGDQEHLFTLDEFIANNDELSPSDIQAIKEMKVNSSITLDWMTMPVIYRIM